MTTAYASVVALLLVGQIQTHGPNAHQRERFVREFLGAMAADREPTIAEFQKYFGPHNEDELILQARFAGARDPLKGVPDAIMARAQERLDRPGLPSLFMRCARKHVPSLTPAVAAQSLSTGTKSNRGGVVTFETPSGNLAFRFPDIEWYFGIELGSPARQLQARQFYQYCQPGRCCE